MSDVTVYTNKIFTWYFSPKFHTKFKWKYTSTCEIKISREFHVKFTWSLHDIFHMNCTFTAQLHENNHVNLFEMLLFCLCNSPLPLGWFSLCLYCDDGCKPYNSRHPIKFHLTNSMKKNKTEISLNWNILQWILLICWNDISILQTCNVLKKTKLSFNMP